MRICVLNANQHNVTRYYYGARIWFLSHAQNIQYAMPFDISKNIIKSFENRRNCLQGLGLLYGKCGEMYEGYFENGKRCGMGKQTYRDWTSKDMSFHTYIGEWIDHKRDGVGTLRMGNLPLLVPYHVP